MKYFRNYAKFFPHIKANVQLQFDLVLSHHFLIRLGFCRHFYLVLHRHANLYETKVKKTKTRKAEKKEKRLWLSLKRTSNSYR